MAQQLICICCVCGYFCLGVVLFWHIFALAYFCLSVFLSFSGVYLSLYLTRCHADWNRVIWPSCSFVAARAELQWLRLFWRPANSLSVCSTHCVHSWCTKCIAYPFSTHKDIKTTPAFWPFLFPEQNFECIPYLSTKWNILGLHVTTNISFQQQYGHICKNILFSWKHLSILSFVYTPFVIGERSMVGLNVNMHLR